MDTKKNIITFILITMILFLFLFLYNLFFSIKKNLVAEKVVIEIILKNMNIQNQIKVFSKRSKGDALFEIDRKFNDGIKLLYELDNHYLTKIIIGIPIESLSNIKNININLGEKNRFQYNEFLFYNNWQKERIESKKIYYSNEELKLSRSTLFFTSPSDVSLNKSYIKRLSKIINWPGDINILLNYLLIPLLTIFIFSLLFIYFLNKKNILLKETNSIFLNKYFQYFCALLIFFLIWFYILFLSGSIFSGFHFVDDHEMIRINYNFKTFNNSLYTEIKDYLYSDFSIGRFRPIYLIHRVLETYIFGVNFSVLSIYNFFLAVLTSFILFLSVRNISFSFIESLFFSLITLVGSQSAIWWRLGPNETIGMFALSLTLFFLIKSIKSSKNKPLLEILFIIFIIITSCAKESFILIIPALIFLKIWLYKKETDTSWAISVSKNLVVSVLSIGIFIFEILIIKVFMKFYWSYAGIDMNLSLQSYFITLLMLFFQTCIPIGFIILIIFLFIFIIQIRQKNIGPLNNIKRFIPILILFSLVIFPQIILYAKSGIGERYLLPACLGISIFLIYIIRYLYTKKYIVFYQVSLLTLTIYLLFNIYNSNINAKKFEENGKQINTALNFIKNNTEENSFIIRVGDPVNNIEYLSALNTYLNLVNNRNNIGLYSIFSADTLKFDNEFYSKQRSDIFNKRNDIKLIFVFKELNDAFINKTKDWLQFDLYEQNVIGDFLLYIRNRNE